MDRDFLAAAAAAGADVPCDVAMTSAADKCHGEFAALKAFKEHPWFCQHDTASCSPTAAQGACCFHVQFSTPKLPKRRSVCQTETF